MVEAPGDDVYIFLDHPYYSATDSGLYGKSGKGRNLYKMFDHIRFADTMKKCKYKFLITYDDSQYIRKLFDWANIVDFKLQYGGSKIGNELFISNYEVTKKQRTIDDMWI